MAAGTGSRRVSPQHQLSDYLQAELLHTLGAYQLACDKLDELFDGVGSPRADTTPREVIRASRKCNEHLRDALHRSGTTGAVGMGRRRHPSPHDKPPPPPSPDLLLRVSDFYNTAATALGHYLKSGPTRRNWRARTEGQRLGRLVAVIHDPQRRGLVSAAQEENLIRGRLGRMLHRLEYVNGLLPDSLRPPQRTAKALRDPHDIRQDDARSFREILEDHTGMKAPFAALHLTVLESLSDAHMWMHEAEHLRAQSFGSMFTEIPKTHAEMKRAPRRSVALNTFVYVAGRTVPWIFAEDEEERDYVLADYESCCETLTPTYCM